MKSTEHLLQEMLDREAIRDLPRLYCHYLWTRDAAGLARLFTEDAHVWMEGAPEDAPPIKGDKVAKLFKRITQRFDTLPFIHNHVIELAGPDRATGTCYYEMRSSLGAFLATGYYCDEYRKVGGQWKFFTRQVKLIKGPDSATR